MIDLTVPDHSFLGQTWGWLLLFALVVIWAVWLFVILPIRKKKHILESIAYCPSLLLPQLPQEYDHISMVPSRKLIQFNYRVNLFHLTCTCQRFRQVRGYYPKNDIRRLCRHLRKELETTKTIFMFDELTQGVISFRLRDSCYTREPLHHSEMIVGFHPRSSIIRVYTYRKNSIDPPNGPFTGPVEKFTYNHRQDNWVYGDPPPNHEQILTTLEKIMTTCKAKYPYSHQLPSRPDPLAIPVPETSPVEAAEKLRQKINAAKKSTTPLQ
ncbi:MAG: hypothetical protein H7839_19185 [Magnetococcus sp. YQC-5]